MKKKPVKLVAIVGATGLRCMIPSCSTSLFSTVRFEDLQFNVKEMIDQVCRCAGAVPREEGKFTYIVDSGKWGPGE